MNKKLFLFVLLLLLIPLKIGATEYTNQETNYKTIIEDDTNLLSDNEEINLYEDKTPKSESLENINQETGFKVIIEDDANLLTDDEKNKLYDKMYALTKYGNIAFKTISYNDIGTDSYAANYYHSTFGTASGTLFLIDMDNREIYIFSDGNNYRTITSSKAYIITDNVYRYATDERYYDCAEETFDEIKTLLDGGKIAEPMRYISSVLISIIIAFIINFIIVLITSKVKKASNSEVMNNCDIDFNIKNVDVQKTGTHRVYSPRDSGSSGGGSSGGGGGGSSGGGGGHGF